jgi:hypothetical protein
MVLSTKPSSPSQTNPWPWETTNSPQPNNSATPSSKPSNKRYATKSNNSKPLRPAERSNSPPQLKSLGGRWRRLKAMRWTGRISWRRSWRRGVKIWVSWRGRLRKVLDCRRRSRRRGKSTLKSWNSLLRSLVLSLIRISGRGKASSKN